MMTGRLSVIALLAVMTLGGCDGESTHDVAWYKTHDAERKAKIAQCENDTGELRFAPNCQNSKKAADELTFSNKNTKIPQF